MESSETIGQLVRRPETATTVAALDAIRVLHEKFGLEKTRALWNLLFEIPFRYELYRKAFEAETRVGCVDRTVARLAKEVREAGDRGLGRKPRLKLLREAPISSHP